ncbi:hypothetical protein GCM10010466_27190 [Planomonospora alba]|uniref:Uncharacterized protein n=1 Tax=Planomonospora alba TaxID=161354 RepID=A0ABP6N327_9ACTN
MAGASSTVGRRVRYPVGSVAVSVAVSIAVSMAVSVPEAAWDRLGRRWAAACSRAPRRAHGPASHRGAPAPAGRTLAHPGAPRRTPVCSGRWSDPGRRRMSYRGQMPDDPAGR